jgi:hypothetical protein
MVTLPGLLEVLHDAFQAHLEAAAASVALRGRPCRRLPLARALALSAFTIGVGRCPGTLASSASAIGFGRFLGTRSALRVRLQLGLGLRWAAQKRQQASDK